MMAKVEKPRITWKKVDSRAEPPGVDEFVGFVLRTTGGLDLYQGHSAALRTGIRLDLPPGHHAQVLPAGVLKLRALLVGTETGAGNAGFTVHVFSVGDFLRIEPGDVIARVLFLPVAAVELVEEPS